MILSPLFVSGSLDEHVKDVVIPFGWGLVHDTCLFEQVIVDSRTADRIVGERDLDKLAKTRRVVITSRLSITERL